MHIYSKLATDKNSSNKLNFPKNPIWKMKICRFICLFIHRKHSYRWVSDSECKVPLIMCPRCIKQNTVIRKLRTNNFGCVVDLFAENALTDDRTWFAVNLFGLSVCHTQPNMESNQFVQIQRPCAKSNLMPFKMDFSFWPATFVRHCTFRMPIFYVLNNFFFIRFRKCKM